MAARWTLALVLLACDAEPPASSASVPADAPPTDTKVAASAAIDPPPAAAAPTLRPHGVAIVRNGATLRAGPAASAPSVRVEASDASGFVVAAVGLQDGMVVVESADDPHTKCARELDGVADFRLRWLVPPDDLVSLTTRRVHVEFEDGTAVTLASGVPLVADGDRWRADAAGVKVRIAIPADAIDRFYDRRDEPWPEWGIPFEPGLRTTGEPLQYDHGRALEGEDALETTWVADKRWIRVADQRGRSLADVRSRCAALAVVVPADRWPGPGELSAAAAVGATAGILGMLSASGGGPTVWRVEPGTDVRWRDGTVAGLVAAQHDFTSPATTIDGRSCFAIAPAGDATIELCFAPTDVHEIAGSPAAAMGGLLGGELDEGAIGFGSGGLGLGGGAGSGASIGSSRRGKVKSTAPTVAGGLDKEVIRRIVHAHRSEVRYCYEQGLVKDPMLAGKVTVSFTIDATGSVASSSLKDSTLSDAAVGACIVKAVKRWKFPAPDGGAAVTVNFPFVFSSL